jgi:hypothetical protein
LDVRSLDERLRPTELLMSGKLSRTLSLAVPASTSFVTEGNTEPNRPQRQGRDADTYGASTKCARMSSSSLLWWLIRRLWSRRGVCR